MSIEQPEILISIVSASWNQGAYVEECILSIDKKFHHLVEHIVIDNCSDDSTHSVLEKYAHLKVIIEPDNGQSEALNKGFQEAKGEWVLWLNIDDYLLPGALEKYLKLIDHNANKWDMLYGHMLFVNQEGERMRTLYQPQWHYFMTRMGNYVAPSTGSLYRRSLLVDAPLDESFHMIMDSEWMLRSGRRVKSKRINKEMVAFRIDGDNKTAAHITTGEFTPQHKAERLKLAERFPLYSHKGETSRGWAFYLILQSIRKLIKFWILSDKAVSKLKAGWR